MELNINDKIFNFVFGYGFLKEINRGTEIKRAHTTQRAGLMEAIQTLKLKDVEGLIDILKKANKTETPRLTEENLEHIFDEVSSTEVFEMVEAELKKSDYTAPQVNFAMGMMEEALAESMGKTAE